MVQTPSNNTVTVFWFCLCEYKNRTLPTGDGELGLPSHWVSVSPLHLRSTCKRVGNVFFFFFFPPQQVSGPWFRPTNRTFSTGNRDSSLIWLAYTYCCRRKNDRQINPFPAWPEHPTKRVYTYVRSPKITVDHLKTRSFLVFGISGPLTETNAFVRLLET